MGKETKIGIAVLAGSVVFAAPSFETILALLWAGGAIAGATSLLVLGAIREPPELVRKAAHVGLWVGNFVASGNILVFPIVFPLALVPVIGGSIVLWQESVFGGALYMSLPFMSLAVIVVAWLVGIPLGAA